MFLIVEYDGLVSDTELRQWEAAIKQYSGEVVGSYCSDVTHILTPYQAHATVQRGMREGKRPVTAYWLSDVILCKLVQPPYHALHIPSPFKPEKKPCTKHIISCSGFEGEERRKLRIMIEHTGAKYTGYFSHHNTLLICKR